MAKVEAINVIRRRPADDKPIEELKPGSRFTLTGKELDDMLRLGAVKKVVDIEAEEAEEEAARKAAEEEAARKEAEAKAEAERKAREAAQRQVATQTVQKPQMTAQRPVSAAPKAEDKIG